MKDNEPRICMRVASEADIPSLCCLYRQLIPDAALDRQAMRMALREMHKERFGVSVFVAEQAGVVIGTLQIVIFENLVRSPQRRAVIESMVVDAAHRRRGVGTVMMKWALRHLDKMRCIKTNVVTRYDRSVVHRLYLRAGFEDFGKGLVLTKGF